MVTFCKGLPLALTVVGASLCGQPAVRWKITLKKWSDGQSFFKSSSKLAAKTPDQYRCTGWEGQRMFLRLGFVSWRWPDCRHDSWGYVGGIVPSWWRGHVCKWKPSWSLFEKPNQSCSNKVRTLAFQKTISCFIRIKDFFINQPTFIWFCRKDAGEIEGYCSEYYITQHDLLRELAIHLSDQEPEAKRKRLFMEIHKNDFPTWLIEQTKHPINARVLSISTGFISSSSHFSFYASCL